MGPPVPIPNTEVKRCSGENTWLATARKDNSMLTQREIDRTKVRESVILTQWVHPFPFRTRKLSAAVAKILSWRRLGKIAHSRHKGKGKLNKFPFIFQYSSLAQSVEHLTVNQGVAGSSPAGGAKKKKQISDLLCLFGFFPPMTSFYDTLFRAKRGTGGNASPKGCFATSAKGAKFS